MLTGSRVGSYEISELLGEGGMGAVYRARDLRLERDVAVKVVQPSFADDPERLARFEREARMLASLSHPHIATIHGLEEDAGIRFLVLELVPGVTLAERLQRGPLPVPEALAAAAQIASAVEAAHEGGVIHRDLKPGNIMLTPAGTVKVLDFGLAKALAPETTDGRTLVTRTSSGTAAGVVLGTAAFMSPEQARGAAVDRRTDVWAFGCVFYEMLTGRRAFTGASESDLIVAVLTAEPDWNALPEAVPASIRRLLRRCLEKDVRRRLRDIGDARLEIEEALVAPPAASSAISAASLPPRRAGRIGWIAGTAAGIVLAGLLGWALKPDAPSTRVAAHFSVALPASDQLSGTDFPAIAMSPAETHIAFIASRGGNSQLYVRPLDSLDATAIAGTDGALSPFFSPDGQWIAFFASGKLKKVAVGGGPVRTIADAAIGFGGVWGKNGRIVFAPNNGSALLQVDADGGEPRQVTTLDTSHGEFSHRWPELSPDGETVIYAVGTEGSWDDAQIVSQPLGGGARRVLVEGGTYPRYLPGARLAYVRGGALFIVPIDSKALNRTGEPQRLLASVLQSSDGAAQFSVASSGSAVYVEGLQDDRRIVWVDHGGSIQPLAAPRGPYSSPKLSPDGQSIALVASREREEIWLYSVPSGEMRQLTFDGGTAPAWSADGTRVAFSASRNGPPAVFWRRIDGSGGDERLTAGADTQVPYSASADRRLLAVVSQGASGNRDIALVSLDGDHAARPFRASPAAESAPMFSPDGRSIAYVSDESGSNEVYVAAADGTGPAVRLSSGGGSEPRWNPNGAEVFFRSGTRMMAAAVRTRPSIVAGAVRVLFDGAFVRGSGSAPEYDVSPDGARFLMLEGRAGTDAVRDLRVLLGPWTANPH